MAVAEEESMDEQDKGTLNYQESKVFHAEPHLCSVYENTTRRVYSFEVYGLDTQDMLHKQYTYSDFDQLFRFNAELMNPNRKEGRYHWVIERMEIKQVGQEKKIVLSNEVTKEVPEVPIYETNRKIPTGRMDMKERKRLREQMDMLQIKRDENIRKKREASKQKFLEHIKFLKEEHARKEKEQELAIEKEREARYAWQLEMDKEEEEQAQQIAVVTKNRRIAAENKDRLHEEKEEEDLRQLRLRWRAADAEKARHIKEARERKAKDDLAKAEAAKEAAARQLEVEAKRQAVHESKDKKTQKKREALVQRALDLIPELKRKANLKIERNSEYLQDWNEKRWPVFTQVLLHQEDRVKAALAEQDAVKAYHDGRAIPKKEKTKGKKGKAKAHKKSAKEEGKEKAAPKKKSKDAKSDTEGEAATGDEGGGGKQDAERIVDGVEAKMRAEMEEMKRRTLLEKKRNDKIKEKEAKRKDDEMKRINAYKNKVITDESKRINEAKERQLVQKEKQDEARKAEERQIENAQRLANVRTRGVANYEEKQLQYLRTH